MRGGHEAAAVVGESSGIELPVRFTVSLAESGRMLMARLEGPLDLETCSDLLQRVAPACDLPRRVLVLDLRHAEYLDSAGVRAILHLRNRLEGAGGELRLVIQPGSRVERTVKLLQLQEYFQIFDSAATAWERTVTPS